MTERDELLAKIADSFAPPWWRPFKRRRWRRFSRVAFASPRSLANWSQSSESDLFFQSVIDPMVKQISESLPDSLELTIDPTTRPEPSIYEKVWFDPRFQTPRGH